MRQRKQSMMTNRLQQLRALLVAAAILCGSSAAFAQSSYIYSAETYSSIVKSIIAGKDSRERGEAIRTELRKHNVRVSTQGFSQKARSGAMVEGLNFFAEYPNPNAKVVILLGAHLDRVAVGEGAIDNASGSAAVIELFKAFRMNPPKNILVKAAFWDQEEVGLVGSRNYVENNKERLPAIYINFDVFGAGDTIWLTAESDELDLAKSFTASAQKAKMNYLVSREYPPSDHLSFRVPGVQSFSFSLGPDGEAKRIIKLLGGEAPPRGEMPEVLTVIHTANDNFSKIDAMAVTKALPVIEAAIRRLDK